MERAQLEGLISRFEALAARKPLAYQWLVFGLAAVGYLYLGLVVLALTGLLLLVLVSFVYLKAAAIKLLVLVGAPLLVIVRSLRVRLQTPSGEPLTRANAPDLYRLLDDSRRQLKIPRLHQVLLTSDFNAGVMQVPRLGLFGWHKNYLLIGLPLMKSLTVEQFRAVLAHELGHLSRGHARVGNWIYRLRLIWQRLNQVFAESSHWGAVLVRPFFKHYIPYFTAASFPLARANEYEADATSLRLTSARSTAQALTAVNIVNAYFTEKFWPDIQAAAKECPQPAFAPFSSFAPQALESVPTETIKGWQDKALARKTSYADTHPSLTDRLKSIGAEAEFAPPASGEGAETLLGPNRARWEQAFDERWRARVAESWKQLHERTQANRGRIVELRAKAAETELDERSALDLANLEEEIGEGPAVALAMRRALVEKYPNSLPVRFALARQLLQSDDAEGIAPMESVVSGEPEAILPGTQLLRDFYARQNDMSRAAHWNDKLLERVNLLEAAKRERSRWRLSDKLAAHQLAPEQLSSLVAQLKAITGVRCAHLARKLTRHFPEKPLYVLGFKSTPWWKLDNRAKANAILRRMSQEVRFPGETIIVSLEGSNQGFAKKIRRVRGSRIV